MVERFADLVNYNTGFLTLRNTVQLFEKFNYCPVSSAPIDNVNIVDSIALSQQFGMCVKCVVN